MTRKLLASFLWTHCTPVLCAVLYDNTVQSVFNWFPSYLQQAVANVFYFA